MPNSKILKQKFAAAINSPDKLLSTNNFSGLFLILIIVLIISWQAQIFLNKPSPSYSKLYTITSSCGIASDPKHVFAYGLYYWNLFPVFPDRQMLPQRFLQDKLFFSKDGAKEIFKQYGLSLKMDLNSTFRSGIMLPLWLPYFLALIKGSLKGITIIPFNILYFNLALIILLIRFWLSKRGLLGTLLVLALGSYPFQICSVYFQDNVFSYSISTIILLTGIYTPLIFGEKLSNKKLILISIITGICLAFSFLMRCDSLAAIFPCLLIIALYKDSKIIKKIILILLILITFFSLVKMFHFFVDYKFNQARQIVYDKGGKVFEDRRAEYHVFWHTLWCGLSDFDKKYKHVWHDAVAEIEAKKVLKSKFNIDINKTFFYNKPTDYYLGNLIPEYDSAMKEVVLNDIKKDPAWFIQIVLKRIKLILVSGIPAQIRIAKFTFFLPQNLLIYLMLLSVLLASHTFNYLKLLIFSLATAIIPICITTKVKYNYYSVVHIFLSVIIIYFLIKILHFFIQEKLTRKE